MGFRSDNLAHILNLEQDAQLRYACVANSESQTRDIKVSGSVKNKKPSNPEHQSHISEFLSLAKTLIVFLTIAFFLRASVVEAFKIPSSSMEPTLQIGDHILVNKLSYGFWVPFVKTSLSQFSKPERGDVVVFTKPDDPNTKDYDESDTNIIKRVMGLPGDVIEVKGMSVYVNGKILDDDSHAIWLMSGGGVSDFGPVTVPEGKVLLLGDNRDHSKDSRSWDSPFLDIERIKGRAFFIYWSFHSIRRMFSLID